MPFDERLLPELRLTLSEVGFTRPTPIQQSALPALLDGRDVLGRARTGSGKTAAFGLPLLHALGPERAVQALVLCPTRELADQVTAELRRLAARLHVRVLTLTGGRSQRNQRRSLSHPPQVVVGTPGRVGAWVRRGDLDLSRLRLLVLDEADRMLDADFLEQVDAIAAASPPTRQTALFSATLPPELPLHLLRDPVTLQAEAEQPPVRQQVALVEDREAALMAVLAQHRPERALVFAHTRGDAARLAHQLAEAGVHARALHGQVEQGERDRILLQLRNESLRVLVATDVAARGLDIPALPLVIVAELSGDPATHVHRVGRTARAGREGLAVSLVCGPVEQDRLARIEALSGPIERVQGLTPAQDLSSLRAPFRTLEVSAGRRDKVSKGDLLGALTRDLGLPGDAIGRIDVLERWSAVAISRPLARQARALARVKGRRVRTRLL